MKTIAFHIDSKLFKLIILSFSVLFLFQSCKEDLPEAGSIPDETPPNASFSFDQLSASNFLEVTFSNASTSATDYFWEFGDGETSTEIEPVHVYPSQGSYTVTLTSSDKLNVESVFELEILLEEPSAFIPPILESGFEDGQLEGGLGDGRDS
ncbi:MAG: PKD domain-containing protein, partial [Bacteroidota bacterium]